MKRDRDWTDVMRSTLRDAETPPPADGWARLERELGGIPAPRVPAWRIHWPRIAAAAAVVICIAVGEYLWQADPVSNGFDGNVIETADGGGSTAEPLGKQDPIPVHESVLAANTPAMSSSTSVRSRNTALKQPGLPVTTDPVSRNDTNPTPERNGAIDSPPAHAVAQSETGSEPRSEKPEKSTRSGNSPTPQSARNSQASESLQSGYTRSGDEFVAYKPPRRKTSFSLFGGGSVTGGSGTGPVARMSASVSDSPMSSGNAFEGSISLMRQFDYARGSFRHHQPLSFGFTVRKEFAHGLSLESGVNYTLLHSDVSLFTGSEEIDQKLHFIGIPLRLNWQFLERGRFSLYIGAGGMVEKCVAAKFGAESIDEPGVQWSAFGTVGAQYKLGGLVGLYFEPEAAYYFTETGLRTSRTDSPLSLTLRLGVRLSF